MKDLVEAASETQPRTIGVLDLRFGGTSQLQNLYQEGASKALFARKRNGAEAICINTSGGITGGDRLTGHFETRDSAHLCVTTQAFERIYRSLNKTNGVIKNSITVRDKSSIYWLPQETLFYDGGYLDRSLVVNADSSASVLIVEPTLFGRIAMGENQIFGSLIDKITLYLDGSLAFQDATKFSGDISNIVKRPAVMAGARATALVIYYSRAAGAVLPKILPILNSTSGASLLSDSLMVSRLIAPDGMKLRQMLIPIIKEITKSDIPRTWRL